MEGELDVIESLSAVGYQGKCLQNDILTKALEGGARSEHFRELVCWLTNELHALRKTDEKVDKEVTDPNEFAMELSAMIKELGCPYEQLIGGPLSGRFQTKESRIFLLEYLITELMATRMHMKLKPVDDSYTIPKMETDTARALVDLTKNLNLGKPPQNISPKALFDKVNFKLEELIRKTNPLVLSEPLMKTTKPLTDEQWEKLGEICKSLDCEYDLRRQVMLTRLEVTIQSFQWSDKMKGHEDMIVNEYQNKLKELEKLKCGGEDTDIVALLAARADLAIIEKTSSANVRKNTGSKIQKHVIGNVPDRGGRAREHAPPPPEMPSWQQQRAGPPGGGGRGGRGGGGGGGGGGNFRGGRGGGGGSSNWQQYAGQQQQQGGGGNFNQRQSQSYDQRPQYEQSNQNQNWITGSGRVQGSGWSQRANDRYGGDNNYDQRGHQDQDNQDQDNYHQQSAGNSYRGGNASYGGDSNARGQCRAIYHRGGSGGGRGGGGGGGGYRDRR